MKHRRSLWMVALALIAGLVTTAPAAAQGSPDLAISVSGLTKVGVGTAFASLVNVTNDGTAATPGVTVSFSTGTARVNPAAVSGWSCAPIQYGHSGRGGGFTTVGESCSTTLATPLAPGQTASVRMTMAFPAAGTYGVTFSVAPYPTVAQLDLVAHSVGRTITVIVPPVPAAPSGVTATQSGDSLRVSWTPDAATQSYLTSSIITATPPGGSTAPVLTQTVSGLGKSGTVFGVTGSTAYAITVVSNDHSGSSPPSSAAILTSAPATLVPHAPSIAYVWIAGSGLAIRMLAASPGNSAIDEYDVLATGDSGSSVASYVTSGYPTPPATNVYDYTSLSPSLTWSIKSRAHNAAGWGPWSASHLWDGTGA